MEELKSGDVVRLKSNGPLMTVMETNKKKQTVYCCWFNKDDKFDCTEINTDMLVKVELKTE
jgi:uncharacterized protein YodC (DUF2158 family)